MALKTFKTATRNITTLRKGLREDIYGADISDVKVVALASDAPSGEREIGIAEFVRSVRAMSDGENVLMTAIAY